MSVNELTDFENHYKQLGSVKERSHDSVKHLKKKFIDSGKQINKKKT